MISGITKKYIPSLQPLGWKLIVSHIHTHTPYYEFLEDHKQVDYADLSNRLASKHLFNSDASPLSFSAVEESFNQKHLISYYDGEKFMKQHVLSMIGITDDSIPFTTTSGCIANYRTVLDLFILNGISRSLLIPRPSDNRLKECIFRSKVSYDEYRLFNYRSAVLNFGGLLEDFYLFPQRSCFFLELGAQYPTGCTLEIPHWNELFDCCKERNSTLWFNLSNGGLSRNTLKDDLQPIKTCIEKSIPCILSIDFTNSLGLQRNGLGCVAAFGGKVEQSILLAGMDGSLQNLQMYSHLFSNPELEKKWEAECLQKRMELDQIRKELCDKNSHCSFIFSQTGPFSTLPLSKQTIKERSKKVNFFLREDGCINLSGIQKDEWIIVSKVLASIMKPME